ncbi:SAV_2336 N-terminal domain-related protein [Streptomyces sp. NPDC058655]|uniref:SAV_2336 N-terminal domain-related protein n=1 Tax=Streptomyces sp. NPDC058655 TaxID=3346577 RepID=UPI0036620C34
MNPVDPPAGPPGGPPAGPPAASAAEPDIRALAALLRSAGLDPSTEELADALWLAGRTTGVAGPGRPGDPGGARPAGTRPARQAPGRPPTGREGEPPGAEESVAAEAAEAEAEDPISLYAAGVRPAAGPGADGETPVEAGVPVRVPGAAALPRILDVQRALRALQRHRPAAPPVRMVLDEAATAEASARALGLVVPVLRPESRREATLRLVMDASPSMAVWQDMFEELRAVCERLGAFRDVQVHHLHRLPDGAPGLGRGPQSGAGLRTGEQLRDPTGRALTMVVSDCAGPLWREGAAQRLLHRWAECTPCVVVQPLPQRLWGRSWLPTERGTLARVGGSARKLEFRSDRPPLPGRPAGGLPVPVLPPNATALGAWARLVAGLGTGPVPAEVGRVRANHPAAAVPPPSAVRPPRELVGRFRSSAAPRAVQLAVYLSAAPLTLPVMRLVQRTMLPDSEPSDLAEVLLSGLLRRSGPPPGQWYEFAPGVQDVLLGPLGRDEAALVLKHCSEYVLAHFGRGVRNFPALAVSQLTGAPVAVPGPGPQDAERAPAGRLPQAFAQVSAKVVRRYLPGPPDAAGPEAAEEPAAPAPGSGRAAAVRAARDRLAAGAGEARALYEAVAVLRRAVTVPAGPQDPPDEAETELAGALLRLWAEQRDPDLLAEAERAVAGLRTAPARAVLGRVLHERALAGARPDAELLAAADREFAAAAASPGAGPELRRDCAVRRAETLIRLSGLRDDPGALQEARAALEPLTGPPPPLGPNLYPTTPEDRTGQPAAETAEGSGRAVGGPDPAAEGPGPAAGGAAPAVGGSGPAVRGPAPAGEVPGPAAGGLTSAGGDSGPTAAGTHPATEGPGPAAGGPAPAVQGFGPAMGGPAPAGEGPGPVDGSPASARGGSGPVAGGPGVVDGPVRAGGRGAAVADDLASGREPGAGPGAGSGGGSDGPGAGETGTASGSPQGPAAVTAPTGGRPDAGRTPGAASGAGRGSVADPRAGARSRSGSGSEGDRGGGGTVFPREGGAPPVRDAELERALGRVLLALAARTPDPGERERLAGQAAARLAWALGALEDAAIRRRRRIAGVRVELAGALRYLPGRLEEAAAQAEAALAETGGDAEPRVAALVCLARVHRARFARDADPAALEDAAEAYGRARRLIPRDAEAFAELLPEWGDVLLDRARAADGRRFTGTAVRVLRESRSAVAQSDPGSAHRLMRLATGLRLRHAYEGDPVDLREAEYLLELAVRQSRNPLERARAWRDHGDVQREIHGHTRAAERLDRAADSYRRAWRSALEAVREERRDTAVRLAARVQELRGEVLEHLARPRAALDAYRAALELWQRLGDADADDAGRPEALRARVRALETPL